MHIAVNEKLSNLYNNSLCDEINIFSPYFKIHHHSIKIRISITYLFCQQGANRVIIFVFGKMNLLTMLKCYNCATINKLLVL